MVLTTDLRAYITLPDDLGEPAATPVDRPSRVLLTGATGYLGAYLLTALLERSEATIVCLVRTTDAHAGLARIQANLARYELVADVSRVEVLPGAVEDTHLGLDASTWDTLARDIDVIVHAAANVNFLPTLDGLLPVNVGGAVNLLRLAGHTRLKPLHLASSYSVFNEASYAGVTRVTEEPLVGNGEGFRRGYPMSKWIAERVTDLARERGFSVTTHRLGLLWGDARTGRSKADDALTLSVRACLAISKAQDVGFLMHVTPVDFAAAAVAEVALAPAHANGYYHAITETPIAWRDFVRGMQDAGHAIDLVSPAAWHDALRAALPAHRYLMPLVLLGAQDQSLGETNVLSMQFDASRLRAALADTGVACPPLDQRLIGTYVDAITRDTAI
jgi:thioester reductase-like protein